MGAEFRVIKSIEANQGVSHLHAIPLYTQPMNDISREELDAKLDATNARVEARLSSFESSIRDTLAGVREDSAAVRAELGEMRGELKAINVDLSYLRSLKSSIWSAAGVTIASVIAGIGVVIGTLAYGVSTFDSGRETSALIQEAKQQASETRQLLEQIRTERLTPPDDQPPVAQPKPQS
ncbi:hypothetical protein [Pseudomonas aeruginosa]|uniref:hypothetical protein n=1 Tax=Pseudomonas aeruginosa TaxID=287 RepID=UPI00053E1F6A|nr:hypothetical protein [Pseudomonas aeruginosa]DBA08797.1 TPA_asm: hypothetical protein [Pseudomonas phage vB_PaeS-D14O]EMC8226789.1 hypothetical protein [Pseudomonas aeruginosa]EMC8488523.1 hypothetical protein [Pseudomonas aeruginosa]EMC8511035.1 hypothetical protein [Pseudomonas aeruginosa]EMC8542727.1 hypothetical protein [Pseudomonas aeruginosa]